ncbi:DNA-binding protein [Sphingobium limneticum]|uniref:ParB/RepB/Spo0J family partition protein n=1 Tax=Sphingomonadales TaxID=204457 RepID=UPI000538B1AE|nr:MULTISPECIES: ParB/RepB/Spo0J family partition protein [Sphingomonadaceae]KAA9014872.1 DNA-binding protein [Sphingobium limneticum]KHA64008.1 DNA-binding protein [Sphingomonas sp. Ant20]QWT15544.1 ParB N-terminal domain-containing protein [Sphingobium xenophagum]|tara:strand:+ start:55125 stop:57230 length:2106 start_codon:yes stop_codon:yes gene_type:complete
MTQASQKIVLSPSRDIPFNKLLLSQSNVRRIKSGVSIEDLAEDIARRTLLQSLNVRAVVDAEGNETGMFEVPAGGRRYRALERLVKQKRLSRTAPVPCVIRESANISAEEDSLAENSQREPLHPLDQFRAFQTLREQGQGDEAIAARFFVTPAIVRQRLKLASVSDRLLALYAEDELTLDQLMAFTVTNDHARQEQVWEALARNPYKEAYQIRRMLTEGAVRASDRRARFIGAEAYEAAGGDISRDLFQTDDGGWFQDPALLDRLVSDKLAAAAETVAAEGWKWISADIGFDYGHTRGLRALPSTSSLTDEEHATYEALSQEYAALEETYAEAEELPDEADQRLGEIEAALEALQNRPALFDPADITRAGAFVSLDSSGSLKIERGFVRPEDEAEAEPDATRGDTDEAVEPSEPDAGIQRAVITIGGAAQLGGEPDEDDDTIKPLPERLMTELTAHRTLALRNAVGADPDTAYLAVLHALALKTFYRFSTATCLEIEAKHSAFGHQVPGLNDTASAQAITARHASWSDQLPQDPGALWQTLTTFDTDRRGALFAHCVSFSINAVHQSWNQGDRMKHADALAQVVDLDMVAAGWTPTVESYLGRVTKPRILEAVRDGKGDREAQLIEHLKKGDMAKEAERLLAGSGWLPEPLRTATDQPVLLEPDGSEPEALPAFLTADEDDETGASDPEPDTGFEHAIAAE